jgi:hypothetical protein
MSWKVKEEVVDQLEQYRTRLFEKRFEGIGNIHMPTAMFFEGLGTHN